MMKKLLLLACLTVTGLNAQESIPMDCGTAKAVNSRASLLRRNTTINNAQRPSNINGLQDTLNYHYNKHTYRNTTANSNMYSIYSSPYPATNLRITHFGAVFQNSGNLTINGLEAMLSRKATSTNTAVEVHVILYNVVNGVPVTPALDSISSFITGTGTNDYAFGDFNTGVQVTGDYAIMYRCASAGDTIMGWANNACTFTATTASAEKRFGEGFGLIRVNGIYRTTTDYLNGTENDREFIVAPRVQFNSVTSVSNPTTNPCTWIPHTYTSSVSSWMTHRQYNLNAFYRYWKPFQNPAAATDIPADSIFVWNFGDATGNQYPAVGSNTMSHTYSASAVGARTGTFTVNYQTQTNYTNRKLADRATFSSTVQECFFESINEINGFENLMIYPNPSVNGKTTISGLTGSNSISVYNMLGQLVTTVAAETEMVTIDLLNQPVGSYFIKINNTTNNTVKTTKIINQN